MGCDIHAWVEHSYFPCAAGDKDAPHWTTFADNFGNRNYQWFAMIAGVRGDEDQQFEPRGWPEDVGWNLAEQRDNVDYHSHSWLSIDELAKCMTMYEMKHGPLGAVWHAAYNAMRTFEEAGHTVRLVFAFDN